MSKIEKKKITLAELIVESGCVKLVNGHLLYWNISGNWQEEDTLVINQYVCKEYGVKTTRELKEMMQMIPILCSEVCDVKLFAGGLIDELDEETVEYMRKVMGIGFDLFFSWLGMALFGDLTEKKVLILVGDADCGKSSLFNKVISQMIPTTSYKAKKSSIKWLDNLIGAYRVILLEELPKDMTSEFCDIVKEIIGNNIARQVDVKCCPMERRTGTSYLACATNSDVWLPYYQLDSMRDKLCYVHMLKPDVIKKDLDINTLYSLAYKYYAEPKWEETIDGKTWRESLNPYVKYFKTVELRISGKYDYRAFCDWYDSEKDYHYEPTEKDYTKEFDNIYPWARK